MNEVEEIWKDIPGYENYAVSNYGRIKNKKSNRLLKPAKNHWGYLKTTLSKKSKRGIFFIHRLVMQAFVENPNNYPQVNHRDENKENNHVSNLEWCTAKYNMNYGTATKRTVEKNINNINKPRKKVSMFSLDMVFLKTFASMTKAAKETGNDIKNISRCCRGTIKTCGGYIWRYS